MKRTQAPTGQPSTSPPPTAPQPSRVLEEPATVERCAQDYRDGAAVREAAEQQWARGRR